MNYPCLIEDELEKSNTARSKWEKRWFIANDTLLYYFEDKAAQKSKGTILYSKIIEVGPDPKVSKTHPHCFFIKVKAEDEKAEEMRYVNASTAELKVKWMESIRTLSTIYKRKDMYSTAIGISEQYRSQLMTNCRKILDSTCKLVGVIKALLGDRSKVKVDPVVILRDTGLVGSTAIRMAGAIIKVLDDPFTSGTVEPMEIAIKQLKAQVEKVAQHANGSSNKGAADYNTKQIAKFCEEMLKLEKPTPAKEIASVLESLFIELDKLFTDSTQLAKQTAIVKLHSQQVLKSARYVRNAIREESRSQIGLFCKECEDKTDELRNAIKEANVYSDIDHQKALEVKHRNLVNHIAGLLKLLEAEWDTSVRKPLLVRIYGASSASERSLEFSENLEGFMVRLPGGVMPLASTQPVHVHIPGVGHKSRLMPLPSGVISSPSAPVAVTQPSRSVVHVASAVSSSPSASSGLPPPPSHPRTASNATPPVATVAATHSSVSQRSNSGNLPPPPPTTARPAAPRVASVPSPIQPISSSRDQALEFASATFLDPTPEEQAAYDSQYTVSGSHDDPAYYDDYGNYIGNVDSSHYYDPNAFQTMEPIQYDEYGNPIYPPGQFPQVDEYGNPIEYDDYGNPILYDENGNQIFYDENGNQIFFDENGNQIFFDENGNQIFYDEYGNQIFYDEYGNVITYDVHGNPIVYQESIPVTQSVVHSTAKAPPPTSARPKPPPPSGPAPNRR